MIFWLFIAISSAILLVALAIHQLGQYINKQGDKKQSVLVASLSSNIGQGKALLIEKLGNNNISGVNRYGYFMPERFVELLRRKFNVKVLSEYCSLDRDDCRTVVEVSNELNQVIIAEFSWHGLDFHDHKKRNRFITTDRNNCDLNEYVTEKNELLVSSNVQLHYSAYLGQDDDFVQEILQLVERSAIENVYYPEATTTMNVYNLSKNSMGQYTLRPESIPSDILKDKILDLSYINPTIEFAGEKHELSMVKTINIMITSMKKGLNVFLNGASGTGKSELIRQLITRLSSNRDTVCVRMNATMIKEISSAAAMDDFRNALAALSKGRANDRIIIFIDEAESILGKTKDGIHSDVQTVMLSLLSGDLKKSLNCSVIMAFNADPVNLNQNIFASHRQGLGISLAPLPANKARLLIEQLQNAYPERVFDTAEFEKILFGINSSPDGTVYATPGEITLGDIYKCFIAKDIYSLVLDMIREQAGKPPIRSKEVKSTDAGNQSTVIHRARPTKKSPDIAPKDESESPTEESSPKPNSIASHKSNKKRRRRRK